MKRNVFICSAGHSGSTLLDMLLGTHPQCESLGELSILPMDFALNNRCGCGTPIRHCALWSKVAERMGIDMELNPYGLNLGFLRPTLGDPNLITPYAVAATRLGIGLKYYELRLNLRILHPLVKKLDEGVMNTLRVYDIVREMVGKPVMIDSSKHHTKAISLYKADPTNTRIILLVRDGRGVYYSNLKRGYGRRYSVRAWSRHYDHALQLIGQHIDPAHVLEIRYEELVTNTIEILASICRFIGIEPNEAMLNVNGVVHHNVNGNDIKFRPISELRIDDAWQTELGAEDLSYFEKHAGNMRRHFRYVEYSNSGKDQKSP